jgi:hypothetical protein
MQKRYRNYLIDAIDKAQYPQKMNPVLAQPGWDSGGVNS